MTTSRLENSVLNLLAAWGGQVVALALVFVTRAVFARELSMDYLGLENLFSNVITILSLAELGIGSSITFALYKPIALGDEETIKSLMRLFKRAYVTIGCLIAVVGIGLSPFIGLFIKDIPDIPYLSLYFIMFVANTSISYFFSYKGLLIYAYQKNYVVSLIQYGFQIALSVVQIVVLLATHNYALFLVCMLMSTLLQNLCLSRAATKMSPFLKSSSVAPVSRSMAKGIAKNAFALTLHKIASIASVPAGTVILTAFAGLDVVALYGSYTLLLNAVTRLLDKVYDAITASVGNLGVLESGERQYEVFEESHFVTAFMYTVAAVTLACSLNPLVAVWLGEQYCFPMTTTLLFVAWFFVKGMRSAVLAFTSAYGLYWNSWYKAVVETVVLLALSFSLVQVWGVDGVVLSGVVSLLFVATVMEAYVVFKYGFKRGAGSYVLKTIAYYASAIAIGGACLFACSFIPFGGVVGFAAKAVASASLSSALFVALYFKTHEFSQFRILCRKVVGFLLRLLHRGERRSGESME